MDTRATLDHEGVELTGAADARAQAILTAGEILTLEGDRFWTGNTWGIRVVDDGGGTIFTLSLSADDPG
jgi:hypothetical protein